MLKLTRTKIAFLVSGAALVVLGLLIFAVVSLVGLSSDVDFLREDVRSEADRLDLTVGDSASSVSQRVDEGVERVESQVRETGGEISQRVDEGVERVESQMMETEGEIIHEVLELGFDLEGLGHDLSDIQSDVGENAVAIIQFIEDSVRGDRQNPAEITEVGWAHSLNLLCSDSAAWDYDTQPRIGYVPSYLPEGFTLEKRTETQGGDVHSTFVYPGLLVPVMITQDNTPDPISVKEGYLEKVAIGEGSEFVHLIRGTWVNGVGDEDVVWEEDIAIYVVRQVGDHRVTVEAALYPTRYGITAEDLVAMAGCMIPTGLAFGSQ